MTDLEKRLKEIESEKQRLEKEIKSSKQSEKEKLAKSVEGKYFKYITIGGTRKQSSYVIRYVKLGALDRIDSDGYRFKDTIDMAICFSRQTLQKDSWDKVLSLGLPMTKYYNYREGIGSKVQQGYKVDSIYEPCKIQISSSVFQLVTEAEFNYAYASCVELGDVYFERFFPMLEGNYAEVGHTISFLELEKLTELNKLLSEGMSIDSLKVLAGKVQKYNSFDSLGNLTELCQYDTVGKNGLGIQIAGGDSGTDYEPFVTHYYVGYVYLDWPKILYPIRTSLTSVLECAEALSNIKEVYEPSNWTVNYDSSTYDAVFQNCKLNNWVLSKVNDTIKKFLK